MREMKRSIDPETTKDASLRREKANLTRLSMAHEREQPQGERFAVCSRQGRRNYNEDRFVCRVRNASIYEQKSIFGHKSEPYDLFAVFDGHGGPNCAEFLKEHFPLLLARSKNLESNPELALRETF
jgi:serine/threonine protein phosphatase PrpC